MEGVTLSRGNLLEEVTKAKLENMKRSDMTRIQLLMEMKEVMKLVKEVTKCKQFESEEEQKQFARRAKAMILSACSEDDNIQDFKLDHFPSFLNKLLRMA